MFPPLTAPLTRLPPRVLHLIWSLGRILRGQPPSEVLVALLEVVAWIFVVRLEEPDATEAAIELWAGQLKKRAREIASEEC